MAVAGRRHLQLSPGVQLDLVGQVAKRGISQHFIPARDQRFRRSEIFHGEKLTPLPLHAEVAMLQARVGGELARRAAPHDAPFLEHESGPL